MRINPVKRALKAGKPQVGTWLSLGSIPAARFMARTGLNWLTVDVEHSLVDWETAAHMFGMIAEAKCTPLARVPGNRHVRPAHAQVNTRPRRRSGKLQHRLLPIH